MTTDHTPPRHCSPASLPATSAPAPRSVAIALALASLLALSLLLPRPASAESLDWMPADDDIGFWGAKLPTPAGEPKNGNINFFLINPANGNLGISYYYETDDSKCDVEYSISENRVLHHECVSNEQSFPKFSSYEDPNYTVLRNDPILRSERELLSIFTLDCILSYGYKQRIGDRTKNIAIINIAQKPTFTHYGYEDWRDDSGNCRGLVRSRSLFLDLIKHKGYLIAGGCNDVGLFVFRFDKNGDIPFIRHRDDLVVVDFDELEKRHDKLREKLRRSGFTGNFAEAIDAILTPYFLEIKRNEQRERTQ